MFQMLLTATTKAGFRIPLPMQPARPRN